MNPNYHSGERIKVSDQVVIGNTLRATVVAVIDDDSYLDGFSKEQWGHYDTGVLVESEEMGLILYQNEEDIATFRKYP